MERFIIIMIEKYISVDMFFEEVAKIISKIYVDG